MNIPPQHIKNAIFIYILWLVMNSCNTHNGEKAVDRYSFVDSLIEYYKDTSIQHPDIAKQKLLEIRQIISDSVEYYKLTQFISYAYFNNNQLDSAFSLNNKVIHFCKNKSTNLTGVAELETYAYFHRSNFQHINSKPDSAIFYLKKAYSATHRTKKQKELAIICIYLAYNYSLMDNFTMATYFYQKAKTTADAQHLNSETYSAINTGLAKVYLSLNNFKMASYYLNLAEKNYKKLTPYKQFVFANIKADYYYSTKNYQKALDWYIRASKLSKTFKLKAYTGITECNLGEIYLLLGKTDSAKVYLDKAYTLIPKTSNNENITFYINGLYAELALKENNLKKAKELLFKHYDLSRISHQNIYLQSKRLESFYKKKGDFSKAYFYSKKVNYLNDSLNRKTTSNVILEFDSRYSEETSHLKQDLIISKSKAELQTTRLISILSISVLIIGIITIAIFVSCSRRKRESRFARQVTTITKLRMENVRNRISPHVLYNILNTVIPTFKHDDNLVHLFRILVQSLRNNLIISDKMTVALEDEMEFVKNYIEFRKKANNSQIEVNWIISPDVPLDTLIISMIIQIPVENSFKYAFEDEQNDAQVDINISADNNFICIIIVDNGIGFNQGRHIGDKNSTGIGLKIIFQTIELLNRRNQEKIFFNIEDIKYLLPDLHGTKTTINIPLKYNFEL
jgi:tetratricopeptide (TPR) repeat protein/two-component sensor histidine kinase